MQKTEQLNLFRLLRLLKLRQKQTIDQAESSTMQWLEQQTINKGIPSSGAINITVERPDGTTNTIRESAGNMNQIIERYNDINYKIIEVEDQRTGKVYYQTPTSEDIQQKHQTEIQESWKRKTGEKGKDKHCGSIQRKVSRDDRKRLSMIQPTPT